MSFDPKKQPKPPISFTFVLAAAAIIWGLFACLLMAERLMNPNCPNGELVSELIKSPVKEPGMNFSLPTFPDRVVE